VTNSMKTTKVQISAQTTEPHTAATADYYCLVNYPPIHICLFFINNAVVRILISGKEDIFPVAIEDIPQKTLPPLIKHEMDQYFEGIPVKFTYPTYFLKGTRFQLDIWKSLKKIPYGRTQSYAWLAQQAGYPKAARAVGNALEKNPIPLIFPCHRVVLSSGGLGGYCPGTHIKQFLLELEGRRK